MMQDTNPYRPPGAEVEMPAPFVDDAHKLAGKGRRFATFVVDYIGFVVFAILVGLVTGVMTGNRFIFLFEGLWSYLTGAILLSIYYLLFEGLWQRTPGKLVAGTIVTDLQGRPPTGRALLKRTLARLVPFEALTFFGNNGFHDRASGTKVVLTR